MEGNELRRTGRGMGARSRRWTKRLAGVLAAACALSLGVPAGAGAVSVGFDPGDPTDASAPPALRVTGGTNEFSDITVRERSTQFFVSSQRGFLGVGRRCTRLDGRSALCLKSRVRRVDAFFGRRADRLVVDLSNSTSIGIEAHGGAGNDRIAVSGRLRRGASTPNPLDRLAVLEGGAGNDFLEGSNGADEINGGDESNRSLGRDTLRGVAGNDSLVERRGGRADNDRFDGGPGLDTLDFGERRDALRVDLSTGRGGASGENDRYVAVEHATTGEGNDTLIGNAGFNDLRGGEGNNVLRGGAGPDLLFAIGGRNTFDGGSGRDAINALDSTAAAVTCGTDADAVTGTAVQHVLEPDCETVRDTADFTSVSVQPRTLTAAGQATFQISCARNVSGACAGTLRVAGGSAPYSVPRNTTGTVIVQLPPADAAAAASASGLLAPIRLEATMLNSFAWTTRLRAQ